MWIYWQSEPGLWTVGFMDGNKKVPESDHTSATGAVERVHYLNGGQSDVRTARSVHTMSDDEIDLDDDSPDPRMTDGRAPPSNRIVITFADSETASRFLTWLTDGNGEQSFLVFESIHGGETAVRQMDYSKAFPARGYETSIHGPDREVVAVS